MSIWSSLEKIINENEENKKIDWDLIEKTEQIDQYDSTWNIVGELNGKYYEAWADCTNDEITEVHDVQEISEETYDKSIKKH